MRYIREDYNIITQNNRRTINGYAIAICELVEKLDNDLSLYQHDYFLWDNDDQGVTYIEDKNHNLVYKR